MNDWIRTIGGRETPAAGRWTIAPGQWVIGRAGRWPHRTRPSARTTSGRLLITGAGDLAFHLRFSGEFRTRRDNPRNSTTTLTYQSISIEQAPDRHELWPVTGELIVDGRLTPARSLLIYHGVFRSGPGAVAWLGWRLRLPVLRLPRAGTGPGVIRHLELTAQLNADAPVELTTFRSSPPTRRAQP